jgi:hypothetical protein
MRREALIILVGITASARARRELLRFYARNSDYAVFVPDLPYRAGLRACAAWLTVYIEETVVPSRYRALHCIAYIAGGFLLRSLDRAELPEFSRLVQFRGPYQELVAAALVRRLGRKPVSWLQGEGVLDMADGWPQALPPVRCARQRGLIIEQGRSRLARLFGIRQIERGAWDPQRLLPDADAVLRIPESHDQVYTSEPVLGAALHFIQTGRFPVAA